MHSPIRRRTLALCTSLAVVGTFASVHAGGPAKLNGNVASANPRVGHPDNVVMNGFGLQLVAQGSEPLENPSGSITNLGLLSDGTRTEPDQNVYLEFPENPGGPTDGYDYGRRFLFQGHENAGDLAYVTRINLDVTDPAHHVTLLTPVGGDGFTHFNSIDGGTWDPFSRTLLFTQEESGTGGAIEVTPGWPPDVRTLYGILGHAGYEGIHPDNRGNLLIIEDAGGRERATSSRTTRPARLTAKQPNSFVYWFVPYDPTEPAGGRAALRVCRSPSTARRLTFHADDPVGDTFSDEAAASCTRRARPGRRRG